MIDKKDLQDLKQQKIEALEEMLEGTKDKEMREWIKSDIEKLKNGKN